MALTLNIKKRAKPHHVMYIVLCTLYLLLATYPSYSQEKNSSDVKKSKNTSTVNGIKYYMHTVEKGQTLYAIAKCYDLSLNDIVIENPEAIDGIKPGQVLKIPVNKVKKTSTTTSATLTNKGDYTLHKAEPGQTLYSIAKLYGTSVDKIKAINPELKDGLKGGQTIKIPSAAIKTESTTTTTTIAKPDLPIVITKAPKIVDTTSETIPETESSDSLSTSTTSYSGKSKSQYSIAFFLPFHADEANQIDIDKIVKGDAQLPAKSSLAIQFYEGAILAIDSLKKEKLNAKVFVYDIDDSDSLNIVSILKKPELATMDLMIGPLYGSSFMPVAKFAKEHSIPIVSPFTQINKILFDNLYVCKVQPSTAKQVEQMAHFVVDTFHTQNIILVNNGSPKEVSFYNSFKNTANKLLKKSYKIVDTVKEIRSIAALESMLNADKINVIVLPSNNQSYVTEFTSKLNTIQDKYKDKKKIILVGMQNWMNYDNLDFEYLNSLSLHIPSNTYIDYQNLVVQNFIKNYRTRFKTEPEMYAYQGYDATYYFISCLKKYGSGFLNNIVNYKYQGIETVFNFMQYPLDSGFENKFVYILKYQDHKLVKAN